MSEGFGDTETYLLALDVKDDQESSFKGTYEGTRRPTFNNVLTRCDASANEIEVLDIKDESIYLKNEVIGSVLEYLKNKMLVHVTSRDILVVHMWQVVNSIHDPDFGNTLKLWLAPLPGFDEETFPFIIASGWQSYNLINVEDMHMEVLIKASSKSVRNSVAGVLLKVDSGFNLHFTTQTITDVNKRLVNWHCMSFKEDFIQTIKEHKRLPIRTYKESLELISNLQKQLIEERKTIQIENRELYSTIQKELIEEK